MKCIVYCLIAFCLSTPTCFAEMRSTSLHDYKYKLEDLYIWSIDSSIKPKKYATLREPNGKLHIVSIGSSIGFSGEIKSIRDNYIVVKQLVKSERNDWVEHEVLIKNISWKGWYESSCKLYVPENHMPPKCWWVVKTTIQQIELETHKRMKARLEFLYEIKNNTGMDVSHEIEKTKTIRFNNHDKWIKFKGKFKEGDEVWVYESPGWKSLSGTRGYVLVRNSLVIFSYLAATS